MPLDLEFAGFDQNAQRVFLGHVAAFRDLSFLTPPAAGHFVLFIGADATDVSSDEIRSVARAVLDRGAVYVLAWGTDSERVEEIFDEAIAERESDGTGATIMTTSHPHESLVEALAFASTFAVPAEEYGAGPMFVVFVGNLDWYDEARNRFARLLQKQAPVSEG